MKILVSLLLLVVALVTVSALPWGGGGYQSAGSYGAPVRVVAVGGYGGDSDEYGFGGRDDNSNERRIIKQW